ncbi:uncharacterized protein LOC123886726 [Trifolium pratense]|uniref:uncharacterized protein LOC123886726 n=1 Tax=Trifolium pratense TaxID=57577 RepID=UPI001E691378|nr:uncharacterized protein LOC123886726 [Trifolium pratense]
MEATLENLNLGEEEVLNFELEENETEQDDVSLCLVGRFVHDRPIKFNVMKVRLAEVWRPVKGMSVKQSSHGLYLFKFFHPLDIEAVIKGGPWTFDNFTLIVERLKVGVSLYDIPLFHVNFWVQIHNVPVGMMIEKVGKGLANYIGEFLEYDKNNNTSFWRQYMRVKVRVDVRKPLKIEKKIAVNGGEGGVVKFKYEKLGLFCFVCGILGHSEDKCDVRYAMERDDGRRSWSSEIRADVRRPGGRMDSRWLHEEGRGRADTFTGSQSRGSAPNSSHSSQSHSERPSAHATERESEPGVNSVVLHDNNDIISTPSMVANRRNSVAPNEPGVTRTVDTPRLALSARSNLRESRQITPLLTEVVHPEQMETHMEKKRRRAEGITPAATDEHLNQHFLSAGPGSSQDCRDS